ncbi:uncharacterized protein PAC_02074 [Phialocephala subalpina]|uniref:PAC domain-containing protein n=1 Tax=Phialocephala subalpina TaxID=576137 RepID=A0A1L7WHI7_9HELO|nr:uncharacterized protein PAC_02074 [Phialocephala subalpina]
MESSTVQSSPALSTPRLSLVSVPGLDDLRDTLFSMNMDGDSDRTSVEATRPPDRDTPGQHEPEFFDLRPPAPNPDYVKIEDVRRQLITAEHLHFILGDHILFHRFSSFLNRYRTHLVLALIRFLEMRKAMKAIEYVNAIVRMIRWSSHTDFCKFSRVQAASVDVRFQDYAARELLLLCTEALPAFVTYTLIAVVGDCVGKDLTGYSIPIVKDLVGNLAEVFCLTDLSVHDNPGIFASEGPETDKDTTLRIAKAISLGQESNEILLTYQRDGTAFVNLLMCAPFYDDKGIVRYFIGAQVDVTGLVREGFGIESFHQLLQKSQDDQLDSERRSETPRIPKMKNKHEKLQELSMMFGQDESHVGAEEEDYWGDELGEGTGGLGLSGLNLNGNPATSSLPGVYKHYLLVRPHPSLQIIFVSPSLRIPGLLRTHLFTKLGGPSATISALESAFQAGASITGKVLWLPKNTYAGERGRGPAEVKPRFIRCTPLLGGDDRYNGGLGSISLTGSLGRRDHVADMLVYDVILDDKRRYGAYGRVSRAGSRTPSEDEDWGEVNGFAMGNGGEMGVKGEDTGRRELYAEYLRDSSSTSGSRDGMNGMNGHPVNGTPGRGRKDRG